MLIRQYKSKLNFGPTLLMAFKSIFEIDGFLVTLARDLFMTRSGFTLLSEINASAKSTQLQLTCDLINKNENEV